MIELIMLLIGVGMFIAPLYMTLGWLDKNPNNFFSKHPILTIFIGAPLYLFLFAIFVNYFRII